MSATETPRAVQPGHGGERAAARTDIQGLRAIAVVLVLVFHLWPAVLPGGYIGVDVFFVVSGFLITAHLVRETDRSGTVSLPRFWARRARRLLPAALTVLAVTVVATLTFVPAGLVAPFMRQITASSLYVENWALSFESVDYMAAENVASPVQHYWSLSVEEQFYLVWPLLVVAAIAVAARLTARGVRVSSHRAIAVALGAVAVGSFVWSIAYTSREPAPAYFVTTTRAWEFAAGGLLALAVASSRWRRMSETMGQKPRAGVAWAGIGILAWGCFSLSGSTPFPGWAALIPVVGTVLVIAADDGRSRVGPDMFLSLRPMQWLGDVSYAVYLWHWPLIVLLPYLLARGLTFADRIAVVLLSLGLAWATTRFVEQPIRFGRASRWRPHIVFAATAASMAVVVLVSSSGTAMGEERIAAEHKRIEQLVSEQPDCLGAASLEPLSGCDAYETALERVVPDPALADDPPDRCITGIRSADVRVCDYGAEPEKASRTIALIGDSHAEQWLPALVEVVSERNWRMYVIAKSSCPFSTAERYEDDMSPEVLAEMNESCRGWNDGALEFLETHSEIDTIVTSTRSSNPVRAERGEDWQKTAEKGYEDRWSDLPQSIENIVVVRDTPLMPQTMLPCVAENGPAAAKECAVDQTDAVGDDPLVDAAVSTDDDRVSVVDFTDYFCVDEKCPPVVGGVLAYRDTHHISWVYAETLAPYVDEQLGAVLGEPAVIVT
ncbi:acyltransferase family protein [Okibacterium endophyticum]